MISVREHHGSSPGVSLSVMIFRRDGGVTPEKHCQSSPECEQLDLGPITGKYREISFGVSNYNQGPIPEQFQH
jgi:hypothetical protein